nr:hypothetical protein [uncultured Roseovarius sp.]
MSRVPSSIIIASVCFLNAIPVAAQDEIIVPRAGIYNHSAPATNKMYETRDAGPSLFKLDVEECGAVLRVSFPDGQFTAVYDENRNLWAGQVAPNAPMVTIEPESETEFTVWFTFGTMTEPAYNSFNEELSAAEQHSSDAYGGITLQDTKFRTEGIYQVETRTYAVRLLNFKRYSSKLRAEHVAILEEALGLFEERDNPDAMCFKREVRLGEAPVEGYAEDRFERRRTHLAGDRARTVADYLAEKTGSRRVEAVAGGESFAPYRAQFCGRAAIATIEVEQEYLLPYTRDQADEWLKTDFQAIAAKFGDSNEGEVERLRAKSQYCLSNSLLDMVEDGHCPAPEFLGGAGNQSVAVEQPLELLALRGIPLGRRENVTYQSDSLRNMIRSTWYKLDRLTYAESSTAAGYVTEGGGEHAAREFEQTAKRFGHPYLLSCGRDTQAARNNRAAADRIEADMFDGVAVPWAPLAGDPTKSDYFDD